MPVARKRAAAEVYVYPMDERPWQDLPRKGVKEKAIRREADTGRYLGLVSFEPLTRSGLHQHHGTAISYFLAGSLSDYQGTASMGMAGINLAGATHDAMTWSGCLLAARLEGPVVVPDPASAAHPTVSKSGIVNPYPERWPEINVPVEPLTIAPTSFVRVGRRMVFDYAPTTDDRRCVALTLMPHAPAFTVKHSALTEWFVLAGDVAINRQNATVNSFVVIEPGAETTISTQYGCLLLAWAEGPASAEGGELYGF